MPAEITGISGRSCNALHDPMHGDARALV